MPRFILLLLFELLLLLPQAAWSVSRKRLAPLPSPRTLNLEKTQEHAGRNGVKAPAQLVRRMESGLGEKRGPEESPVQRPSTRPRTDAGPGPSAVGSTLTWWDLPGDVRITIARRGYLNRILESHWNANRDTLLGVTTNMIGDASRWAVPAPLHQGTAPVRAAITRAQDRAAEIFRHEAQPHFHALETAMRPSQRGRGRELLRAAPTAHPAAEHALRAALLEYARQQRGGFPRLDETVRERLREPLMHQELHRVLYRLELLRDGFRPGRAGAVRPQVDAYRADLVAAVRRRTEAEARRATGAAIRTERMTAGPRQRAGRFWDLRRRAGAWAARIDADPRAAIHQVWEVRPAASDVDKAAQQVAQEYALGVWGDVCHAENPLRGTFGFVVPLEHGWYGRPRPVPVPRGLRRRRLQQERHPA